jgi:hypothetical protein
LLYDCFDIDANLELTREEVAGMTAALAGIAIEAMVPLGIRTPASAENATDVFLSEEKVKGYENQLKDNMEPAVKKIMETIFGAGVDKVGKETFVTKVSGPELKGIVHSYGFRNFVNSFAEPPAAPADPAKDTAPTGTGANTPAN